MDRRLDTEARGLPAVTATTVRVSSPWTPSNRKARVYPSDRNREALAAIAYMPKAVVTGSGKAPKRRRHTAAVVTYHRPLIATMAPSNGGNPDA